MDPSSKKIFVSYVEEDGDVAHEIAQHLEAHGYSSWYYERDCPAGADYFEETFKAISECEAMAIIISPRSLPSDQITREIVRAVEANKATLPLLLDLTHDEYAHRRPGWKQAMAAANATRLRAKEIPGIIPALVAGLHAKGIKPHPGAQVPPAPTSPQSGVIAAPAVSPQSGVVAVPDFSPKSDVIAAADLAPISTSSGTIAVPPQRTEPMPMRDAQTSTAGSGSVTPGGKLPLIPIAVGAAVLIAAFAGWHFLKAKPQVVVVPPPAPVGATVMLRYNVDRHMCTPDLNMTLAGKSYHLATNPYAVSGVPLGVQHYTIDGVVSCPNRHPSKASGGGDIDVREGAVFDMNWEPKPGAVGIMDVVDASTEPVPTAPVTTAHVATHAPASPPPTAVVQQADPAKPLLVKANAAYAQGRYFEPANDSALHWAILAGRAGSPAGKTMEQQLGNLFRAQLNQLFQQQNYPAALHLVNALLVYYPGNAELVSDQQRLLAAQNGGPVQQVQMNQAMQQMLAPGQRPPAGYPNSAQRPGPGAPSQSAYDAAVRAQARAAAQAALAQQRAAQSQQSRPH
jgi:TIR domain